MDEKDVESTQEIVGDNGSSKAEGKTTEKREAEEGNKGTNEDGNGDADRAEMLKEQDDPADRHNQSTSPFKTEDEEDLVDTNQTNEGEEMEEQSENIGIHVDVRKSETSSPALAEERRNSNINDEEKDKNEPQNDTEAMDEQRTGSIASIQTNNGNKESFT